MATKWERVYIIPPQLDNVWDGHKNSMIIIITAELETTKYKTWIMTAIYHWMPNMEIELKPPLNEYTDTMFRYNCVSFPTHERCHYGNGTSTGLGSCDLKFSHTCVHVCVCVCMCVCVCVCVCGITFTIDCLFLGTRLMHPFTVFQNMSIRGCGQLPPLLSAILLKSWMSPNSPSTRSTSISTKWNSIISWQVYVESHLSL